MSWYSFSLPKFHCGFCGGNGAVELHDTMRARGRERTQKYRLLNKINYLNQKSNIIVLADELRPPLLSLHSVAAAAAATTIAAIGFALIRMPCMKCGEASD